MYRLTILHDEMPENPNDEDTLFRLHSFSTRHINFTDPDVLLACQYEFPEGHEDEGFACDEMPTAHGEGRIEDHDWVGPRGFMLSYFEHGLCKWGLEGTMSGMPDFRWDGVRYAGYLEVLEGNEWFEDESPERQRELASGFVDYYTKWCNGEAYGFILEEVSVIECDLELEHETVRHLDSCSGFIGEEGLVEEVRANLTHYEITEDQLEVVDKAYGSTDFMEFFPKVTA